MRGALNGLADLPQWSPDPKAGSTSRWPTKSRRISQPQRSPDPKTGSTEEAKETGPNWPRPQWSPGPNAGSTAERTRNGAGPATMQAPASGGERLGRSPAIQCVKELLAGH